MITIITEITVISPDSAGSKGDEAVVRGALTVFRGADVTLLTPNNPQFSWSSELLDLAGSFNEKMVRFDELENSIIKSTTLIVLGTDIVDGTDRIDSSLCRLGAVEKNKKLGGKSLIFLSFRSNVNEKILSKIELIGDDLDKVLWFCRDFKSIEHFNRQCGLSCSFFPDFAFYVKSISSIKSEKIINLISEKKKGKVVVGVNNCHHSFISFYPYSIENIRRYVSDVVRTVKEELGDVLFVFIPNDIRQWGGMWSDYKFAQFAFCICEDEGIVLPADLKFIKLLSIVSHLDLVITGRMHLAISSIMSEVIPIIFTGSGYTDFSNVDKCLGMISNRIGDYELVVSSPEELKKNFIYG